jgi:PAS domain S-box-containing protein
MTASAALLDARILVVDDLDADARLVEAMLQGAGFRSITTINDPFAAAELHRTRGFDLVILDVLMPGMDGFEVMAKLQAQGVDPPVPVIVVTAEPEHIKRALDQGARDFIGKPLRMAELVSRTRNALELGFLLKDAKARGRLLERTLHERTADLEDAEGRYRALVEQSIAGIYIVEDGRFTYANPRLCEWLGYTAEELRCIPTIDLVVEEDRERLIANRAKRDVGDAGGMLVATYRMLRRDGRVLHLSYDARLMELRGRRVIFGIAQDVTERERSRQLLQEAESHYRALVEQSIVGIYLMDRDSLIYANPRMCEILGYTFAEMANLNLRDLVIPQDHATLDAIAARRRAGDSSSIALQVSARRKDAKVVHLGVETKVIDLAGRRAAIGVVQDVTVSKRAQDELRAANQRLRTLSDRVLAVQEEERRHISRELHDDVGQSIVALGIGLHRLEAFVDPSRRALLAECIDVADAVRERIREISVELHPPHLDQLGLQDALRWLVNRHRDITGMDVACRFSGVEELRIPPVIEAACYRICQEALNNATRHASPRSVTVELSAANGRLVVRVSDDGVGFDQAEQRVRLVTSGNLGLISMEERARLAGGKLELRSAPHAGTCVSALFPIDARAESSTSREHV